jgi:hypothetical protein
MLLHLWMYETEMCSAVGVDFGPGEYQTVQSLRPSVPVAAAVFEKLWETTEGFPGKKSPIMNTIGLETLRQIDMLVTAGVRMLAYWEGRTIWAFGDVVSNKTSSAYSKDRFIFGIDLSKESDRIVNIPLTEALRADDIVLFWPAGIFSNQSE